MTKKLKALNLEMADNDLLIRIDNALTMINQQENPEANPDHPVFMSVKGRIERGERLSANQWYGTSMLLDRYIGC